MEQQQFSREYVAAETLDAALEVLGRWHLRSVRVTETTAMCYRPGDKLDGSALVTTYGMFLPRIETVHDEYHGAVRRLVLRTNDAAEYVELSVIEPDFGALYVDDARDTMIVASEYRTFLVERRANDGAVR